MSRSIGRGGRGNPEAWGFVVSLLFVGLASIRDVYLAGLFQLVSPLLVAVIGFTLCSLVFLPIAQWLHPVSLRELLRRPHTLFWINATSAIAWIAFFYALRTIEPSLVQILYSGIGPLSIVWIDRLVPGVLPSLPITHGERLIQTGLLTTLLFSAAVAISGLSGVGPQPLPLAVLGVALAAAGGFAISLNTLLCRTLNDVGVEPVALVALRFPGAVICAAVLAVVSGAGVGPFPPQTFWLIVGASLLLIVFPIYVNQVGISLASPLTVRVVLAGTPVLIFCVQLVEGRLSSSPYSLAASIAYAIVAITALLARRRAIRSAALARG